MTEFLPYPISSLIAGGFLLLLGATLLLNIFGLPANWLIIALCAIWKLASPQSDQMGLWFWIGLFLLALAGEALETGLQIIKSRHYGSSSGGTFGGVVGALAGAILLAPLFWGLGALLGAMAGAWAGCYMVEKLRGRPNGEARSAAWGAMFGRMMGLSCKLGIGCLMIALIVRHIWPELPDIRLDEIAAPDPGKVI